MSGRATEARYAALFPRRLWTLNTDSLRPKFNYRRSPLMYTVDSLEPPMSLTKQQIDRLRYCLTGSTSRSVALPLIGVFDWKYDPTCGTWVFYDTRQRRLYELTEQRMHHVYGLRPLRTAILRLENELEIPVEPPRQRQPSLIPSANFSPGRELFASRKHAKAYDQACSLIRQMAEEGVADGFALAQYIERHEIDIYQLLTYANCLGELLIEDVVEVTELLDSYVIAQEDVNRLDTFHNTDRDAKAWDDSLLKASPARKAALAHARAEKRREARKDLWKARTFNLAATDTLQRGSAAVINAALAAEAALDASKMQNAKTGKSSRLVILYLLYILFTRWA